MDIPELAREFDIDPSALESALNDARSLMAAARENVRPANKQALAGVATAIEELLGRLSEPAVMARLYLAAFEEPAGPDEQGLERYAASCDAQKRVEAAIGGAGELLAFVRASDAYRLPIRDLKHTDWLAAADSLVYFWRKELGRPATISGHPNDPRGVKPSPLVRFINGCLQHLGAPVTVQTCRTLLTTLKNNPPFWSMDVPSWQP